MFEAYFFDKRTTMNYRVYRVLKALEASTFTVNRLSQEAQLSYSQAYNAFQDIMADLQVLQHTQVEIADEDAYRKLSQNVTVDQYRYHLLTQSMSFAFFDYLFKACDPDVHTFCSEHDISISTLHRRVDAFKNYLQTKGVSLNTSSWALEGSELRIRMVILNFFILGYRGAGWPLDDTNYQATLSEYGRIAKKYPDQWFTIQHQSKQDLLAICVQQLRMHQGHYLPQEQAFTRLTQAPGMPTLPPVVQAPTPRDAVNESGYFYFLRMHYLSLSTELTATDHWLITHFQQRNDEITAFADGLLNTLLQAAPADAAESDPTAHELLRANLYRMSYSYWLFGGDFSRRIDFYDDDKHASTFGRLPALIDQYFDQLQGPVAVFMPYRTIMKRVIYSVLRSDFPVLDADHQLAVAVLIEPGTFALRDVLHFLDGISFVRLTTAHEQAAVDVILTTLTSPELIDEYYGPSHPPVIQWQAMAAEEDYYRLYAQLLHRHQAKMAAATKVDHPAS